MVDSINNNENRLDSLQARELRNQNVSELNRLAAQESQQPSLIDFLNDNDGAIISDEAKTRFEAEKETLQFSRVANRAQVPFDRDKVSRIKDLLDSGRINDYLRDIGADRLASAILNDAPTAKFLLS